MGQVSHEQVDLMLRLYELRREPRLRQAREWFMRSFHPQTLAERASFTPEEDTNVRMVTSYWEMAAGLVRRGMVEEDMFFESNAEFWIVWDRLKPISGEVRALFKDPYVWDNLEKLSVRYEHWRERRAPGSTAALRERMQKARTTAAQPGR
ncbi:MAG TPA: hypothetical protein VNJ12_10150 [Candidatus Dormibacteraeota bacterium]|nr:hypothetical protein [Candidatus Dormibacteraeota bacterium]